MGSDIFTSDTSGLLQRAAAVKESRQCAVGLGIFLTAQEVVMATERMDVMDRETS